jgi:hypothetical protein
MTELQKMWMGKIVEYFNYYHIISQDGKSQVRFPIMSLDISIDLTLAAALWPWGRLSLYQKRVPGIFLRGKGLPARKADNLTVICEPTV